MKKMDEGKYRVTRFARNNERNMGIVNARYMHGKCAKKNPTLEVFGK